MTCTVCQREIRIHGRGMCHTCYKLALSKGNYSNSGRGRPPKDVKNVSQSAQSKRELSVDAKFEDWEAAMIEDVCRTTKGPTHRQSWLDVPMIVTGIV